MNYSLGRRPAPEPDPRAVLVLGASLPGLCVAQGLRRGGVPVAVFPGPRARGVARSLVRLDPREQDGLAACLPGPAHDEARRLFAPTPGRPDAVDEADAPDDADVLADRECLRRVLLHGLERDLTAGTAIGVPDERPDGVRLRFDRRPAVFGSCVVLTRRHPGATLRPRDTGVAVVHGSTALDEELVAALPDDLRRGRPLALPAGNPAALSVAVHRAGPGYVRWSLALPVDSEPGRRLPTATPAVLRRIVMEQTAGCHDAVGAMLARGRGPVFWGPVRAAVADPWSGDAPVTALGSAAHVVPHPGAATPVRECGDAARLVRVLREQGPEGLAGHEAWIAKEGRREVTAALTALRALFGRAVVGR